MSALPAHCDDFLPDIDFFSSATPSANFPMATDTSPRTPPTTTLQAPDAMQQPTGTLVSLIAALLVRHNMAMGRLGPSFGLETLLHAPCEEPFTPFELDMFQLMDEWLLMTMRETFGINERLPRRVEHCRRIGLRQLVSFEKAPIGVALASLRKEQKIADRRVGPRKGQLEMKWVMRDLWEAMIHGVGLTYNYLQAQPHFTQ